MIRYVAFGTDCFCRFKFQKVRNAEKFSTLPAETVLSTGDRLPGGLIGYPIGYKNGMPSDVAWDASFELMADRKSEQMFSFQLHEEKIQYNIGHSHMPNMIERSNKKLHIDFDYLEKICDYIYIDHDAIMLDEYGVFEGWEIHDTVLVMNPWIVIAKKK